MINQLTLLQTELIKAGFKIKLRGTNIYLLDYEPADVFLEFPEGYDRSEALIEHNNEKELLYYLDNDLTQGTRLEVYTAGNNTNYKKLKLKVMQDLQKAGFGKGEITDNWEEVR